MLLQVDVPAADFFPAMDRFLHRYDASVVPLENYYPLSAAVCRQMDVCAAGDSLLCVTDEAAPTFYIAKHVTDDPAVGRDIGSLQSLWARVGADARERPEDVGPLARASRYHMFRIVGRPYALSAKVLAGLNSTQKRQIITWHRGQHLHATPFYAAAAPPGAAPRAATTSAARERTAALCWRCSRR